MSYLTFRPKIKSTTFSTRVGWEGAYSTVEGGTHDALLMSENHARMPNGSWSGGGPFFVVKNSLIHRGKQTIAHTRNNETLVITTCGVSPAPRVFGTPDLPKYNDELMVLQHHFPAAYKKARPGSPVASAGQFLIELRDLPKVPGLLMATYKVPFRDVPAKLLDTLSEFRALGKDYLNGVFGWKPFVSDVRKMYNLQASIDKRMAQIVRENGKAIRKRVTVSSENAVTQSRQLYPTAYVNVYGAGPTSFYATEPQSTEYTVTRTTKEKIWFVGSFRYWIPDTSSSQWTRRARLALFGALPTPELLYEVVPWSWLVDWFSNVGDVVANVSPNAVDNLQMDYSFIMRHVIQETEWKAVVFHPSYYDRFIFNNDPGHPWSNLSQWPAVHTSYSTTQRLETKSRMLGGNPYGLSVRLPSLSLGQMAILAALGSTRGKGSR